MDNEKFAKLADEAIKYISDVCEEFGPRISGSKEERKSLEQLEEKLKKFSDFTYFDTYPVYPTFYPGEFVLMVGILVILSVFTFFLRDFWVLLSLALPILGLFIFFISLVKMKTWFAFFSKKGISHNATGRILPRNSKGEIISGKLKIIIAGHSDSALMMKITRFGEKSLIFFAGALVYIVLIIVLSVLKVILIYTVEIKYFNPGNFFGFTLVDFIFLGISIVGMPIFLIALHGFVGGTPVLGANDNLSGVGLALAIGKYFSQDKNRLHNVELWVGSFGSEECGERGSAYFIEKYSKLGLLENCTAVIPESIGGGTNLGILTRERMHFAFHDESVCKYLDTAYQTLLNELGAKNVVDCRIASDLKMGASDGGRFALAGYPSSTIFGYEGSIMKPANWHELTDDPTHLSHNVLRTAIGIYVHFIKLMEKNLD